MTHPRPQLCFPPTLPPNSRRMKGFPVEQRNWRVFPENKKPRWGLKGLWLQEVCSTPKREGERGRRERFSRNRCTLPPQVYYVEFQEAQVQREFLVMLDISGVLPYWYCYFYSVQQPHQSMFLLSIYYDMNVLDWVFCIDHYILSSYLLGHSLLAHSGEDSK